ncbi:MAG: hypothetical protein ACOYJZ_04890 [Acutalibacter sp.]
MAAVLMAGLLCFGVFAGCSEAEESSSSESSSATNSTSSSSSDVSSQEEDSGAVIGQITYIGSSTLVLDVYQADEEITDYTDMGPVTLTDAEETQSISVDDNTVYESVADGTVDFIMLDDLTEGDMVAVTTDEAGMQTVIVLNVETSTEDVGSDEDSSMLSESPEVSMEQSALEEATGEITSDED